ncbi:MAG: hypothetical protein AAFQ98_14065, partial [Bacteroidota bacterium]
LQRSREILGQFLPGHSLPQRADQPWYSPIPIGELLARYAVAQLEAIGCEADYEEFQPHA